MTNWYLNAGFSPMSVISAIFFIVLLTYPVYRILTRIGINGWFAVLTVIPFVSIIAVWVLAFISWPNDAKEQNEELKTTRRRVKKSETLAQENTQENIDS